MNITQLLTPMTDVQWLTVTDTVRDAFDLMETYERGAVPLIDWDRRYLGTVTEADLRRHVASATDGATAMATPLAEVERRARNLAVTVDRGLESIVAQASTHPFVPVVDDCGRLIGVVDRRRILDTRLPSAA